MKAYLEMDDRYLEDIASDSSKDEKSLFDSLWDKKEKKAQEFNADVLSDELLEFLKEKEKEVIKFLETDAGNDILKQVKSDLEGVEDIEKIEVKSIDDLVKKLEGILNVEAFKQLVFAVMRKEFIKGAEESEEEINKIKPFNYIPDKDAIDYIAKYTFDNIKGMTDDIANDLRVQLQMGFMNGEGIAKLKNRVQEVMNVSNNRAKTIARTESARASHFGKLSAYKQSGTSGRKWLLWTNDDRTSDITKALHKKYGSPEKAIPLEENFKLNVKIGKKQVVIDQPAGPFHPNERDELMIELDD